MASVHSPTEQDFGPANTEPGSHEGDSASGPQDRKSPRDSLDKAPPDHEGGDTRSHEADRLKPVLDKSQHAGTSESRSRKRATSYHSGDPHDPDSKPARAQTRMSERERIKDLLSALGDDFELAIDAEEPLEPNVSKVSGGPYADGNADRFDYQKRHPPDEAGKEMSPGARVWRVYLDEAAEFDLIWAGLFLAIVTTLVALTATALQVDDPKVTNMLLMELIAIQSRRYWRFHRPDYSLPS
ncbi:hypothetical protein BDV98DRAFT_589302 [Pterulicium gracile]|uniref:DUF6535 domain-containing protein n=1 Tax=Pterulicium gracile TaxID=1884261 RepID=A0A5C3R4A0_9AGAR|nr:hypothetical protein BDV98DRAFT_589302 [Pterula gracilis]